VDIMLVSDPLLLPNILIVCFLLVLLTIAAINMHYLRNLSEYKWPRRRPRISVLIPARDEEQNVGPCVRSLLAQDYPNFQVIVLDDNSTDHTSEVLEGLRRENNRLVVLRGKYLPSDWLGKHWACHQLYKAADGDLLMFTDSDTVHAPDTLSCSAAALQEEKADMLSVVPRHVLGTLAEKLTMPQFALGVFAMVPLPKSLRPKKVRMLSSSGKLMVFRRDAYEACGGFEAIRQNVLDDLELPQSVLACGLRYRIFDGTNNVSCRMYHSPKEVYEGLTKNMFASYDYNIPLFIATWLWVIFIVWEPIIMLASHNVTDYPPTLSLGLAAIAILATALLFCIYYQRFKFPLYMILLYPVSIVLMAFISWSSMFLTLTGRATWKDRKMPNRKMY
jgi:chlorobactene glucosyltransferase